MIYLKAMKDKIEGRTAIFSMIEKNILHVAIKENALIDVPEADENYEITMQITEGKRYAVLVGAYEFATITPEATKHAAQAVFYRNVIAQAIVVKSLANGLVANFVIQFNKRTQTIDTKLFNDNESALAWLRTKIKEDTAATQKASKPR